LSPTRYVTLRSSCFQSCLRPPPSATLFPYTTLFRSVSPAQAAVHAHYAETGGLDSLYEAARRLQRMPVSMLALQFWLTILALLRSEEHTSELQSRENLVCRLLLEKKNETSERMACHL